MAPWKEAISSSSAGVPGGGPIDCFSMLGLQEKWALRQKVPVACSNKSTYKRSKCKQKKLKPMTLYLSNTVCTHTCFTSSRTVLSSEHLLANSNFQTPLSIKCKSNFYVSGLVSPNFLQSQLQLPAKLWARPKNSQTPKDQHSFADGKWGFSGDRREIRLIVVN